VLVGRHFLSFAGCSRLVCKEFSDTMAIDRIVLDNSDITCYNDIAGDIILLTIIPVKPVLAVIDGRDEAKGGTR
jgi:hypothetical protein